MSHTAKQNWGDLLLEQGRAKGELRALQDDLRALLEERFGQVPQDVLARIAAATDPQRLQACIRQVLHISSPEELEI